MNKLNELNEGMKTSKSALDFQCIFCNPTPFLTGGIGDDLQQASDLGLGVERHGEEFDGGVVDVVVSGDHAQVERRRVHVVLDGDAFGLLQIRECVLDQFGQMIRQMTMRHSLQVVVVGILRHSPYGRRW